METKPKKITSEEKQKKLERIVAIGIRIMPKFQAKPNPHKK